MLSVILQAHKVQEIGSKRGKLSVEDFLYLVRKVDISLLLQFRKVNLVNVFFYCNFLVFFLQDPPKLNRCKELLSMQEELKQARKAFDPDEEKLAASVD